ncbi:MAG: hypothetical protein QN756_10770 [Nitrososphaeraceae archaeon]|nr:hypothetical protein [Nitrososphaeraceae archaeon]
MLNIEKDSIKVYKQSIFPAITFTVTDNQLEEDTIPIRIDGIVLSSDWKYIANLLELPDVEVRDNPLVDGRMVTYTSKVRPVTDVSAGTQRESNSNLSKTTISFKTYKSELAFTLNDKILEHIERLRQRHRNKDMVLYSIFKLSYIRHSIKLGNYPMKRAANDNNIARVSDNNSLDRENNSNNSVQRILVKENKKNNDNGLIFYVVDQFRRQIIIPSNKWTDNFQLQLGN